MEQEFKVFLVLLFQTLLVAAQSSFQDFSSLQALTESWENKPPSWVGTDPCGSGWEGIWCTNSRVTSIILGSMNLVGRLSSEIELISELENLDLSFNKGLTGTIPEEIGNLRKLKTLILVSCDFSGPIPESIGSLQELTFLALNSNQFNGSIPHTIGNLSNIIWLDLSDNQLEGPIPISDVDDGEELGVDKLLKAKHFHMGNNRLSGGIPDKLFSPDMSLVHVLLDSNQLNGRIPSTVGYVNSLEVVRLDRNQLSGGVPSNITDLGNLSELYLSNNGLNGSLPDLTGMNLLSYVDLSNNTFTSSGIPSWASSLQSLTTLKLANTGVQGQIPVSLFSPPNLESVVLRDNQLNGTLDIGNAYSNRLELIDLENNKITDFNQANIKNNVAVLLAGNLICVETGASNQSYCQESKSNSLYSTPPNNCATPSCSSDQISSPNCKCAHPYTGHLYARSLSFSDLGNASYYKALEQSLMNTFQSQNLPVDSVSLSNPFRHPSTDYFGLSLKVFPSSSDSFNRTGVSSIAFVLTNQIFKAPKFFLPYFFIGDDYGYYAVAGTSSPPWNFKQKEAESEEEESEEEESGEESEEETTKAKGTQGIIEVENPNLVKPKTLKVRDIDVGKTTELSRREREEIEKQRAHERYMRLQEKGKTEKARKDLERLALIRQQRAEAAKKREEEKAAKEPKKAEARK